MVIFVSDLHLTDSLVGTAVPKVATFERFWTRIQVARGARPAHLVFVGDLFDIVRSPAWLESAFRPYHEASPHVAAMVERVVEAILARESAFFHAIRSRVATGELEVHYCLGNHDRLLREAPGARRAIWRALTGEDRDVDFPDELEFPDHGVLAYHGHRGDPINDNPDGGPTVGDAIGCELIVRFPRSVRLMVGEEHPELDDIDDVRPIYAVPAWVRSLGTLNRELMRPVARTWSDLVEDFFAKPFVKDWMRQKRRRFGLDTGKKLRMMLEASTGRLMAHAHDERLTKLYKVVQHSFDGRMARQAAEELESRRGLRYAVNGHSHFSSLVPLGNVGGAPGVYFNTGTWRTVHQIGVEARGRPSFLPYDAMSYLVFFPSDDPLGRDYEWWTGAMVSATSPHPSGG